MALVVAKDLRKNFEHLGRTLEVLRGVDLSIDEGEMVGVVGQSGAGKSTFLHCLGTLDVPSSGSLSVGGKELTSLDNEALADLRNKSIGFVFQFHHLLPEFNALENVMMPGLIQGLSRKEMTKRAEALLDDVGLKIRASHRPGELSGGEQQRVALARALVLEPKLILADEPTGNLDSKTSDQIHELFFRINKERKTTIVVVTHNMMLADSMPRKVTMRDGRVEKDERNPSAAFRS
jgi:lipoprotein-releasing system ATP-binding protein